jgi:hypothetical protein
MSRKAVEYQWPDRRGRPGPSAGGEHDGPFGRKRRELAVTGHLGTVCATCGSIPGEAN